MTNWQSAMREAAERDEQDHLSADEAQAMRRIVTAAVVADASDRATSIWTGRPVLVAATIVAIISVGVGTGLRLAPADRSHEPATATVATELAPIDATNPASVNPASRQLQFMTAGGTRIIWVFNSELDLKATLR